MLSHLILVVPVVIIITTMMAETCAMQQTTVLDMFYMSNDERLHIYGFMHCEIDSRDIDVYADRGIFVAIALVLLWALLAHSETNIIMAPGS